jgi:hypothetical protein
MSGGLIDEAGGLAFGDGLEFQEPIGDEGLDITTTPSWVLTAGGVPATIDIDFVDNLAWNSPATTTIPTLLTCVRAQTVSSYYTNADGTLTAFSANQLRTGTNGALIEVSRTNLVFQSQTFDNGSWSPSAASVSPNVTSAPDGTSTADLVIPNTSNSFHGIQANSSPTVVNGTTYTFSVYAKAAGYNFLRFFTPSTFPNTGVYFNVSAGTIGTTAGTPLNTTITALANGWFRCSFSVAANSSGSDGSSILFVANTDGANGYTGDGTSGIYLWGAQIEAGSSVSSYIPTTSSSATRNADVITYAQSLSTFTPAAGTFYAQLSAPPIAGSVIISDTTAHSFSIGGSSNLWKTINQGTAAVASSGVADTTAAKIAASYAATAEAISANGGAAGTGTSGNAVVQYVGLTIGSNASGSTAYINTYLKRLTFWNSQVSNANLAVLTT